MSEYKTTFLKDYKPCDFAVQALDLTFDLGDECTIVRSSIQIQRTGPNNDSPLYLNGENLKLVYIAIDDQRLADSSYLIDEKSLQIFHVPEQFTLEIHTEIKPQENTSLTGLYKSINNYCTQCEAEGFRRITYYFDRPDVMTVFTTTIIADKSRYPHILSNGNLIAQGETGDGRHSATWHDPFKKPCYLFALVAGDFDLLEDRFVTSSGREVALKLYVEKGYLNQSHHAMDCLKNAMRWDEQTFGREYDLDIFMIVAVSDFNMGAMENKGLNIFNTRYILGDASTATDQDFEGILGVVGHEYFHNWTGNRITCRDWFQLSLKEGLTIFRDQEFTSDLTSRTVKRIQDVRNLRTFQFAEDASPMAHPVRPDSYIEINNFYTRTVYEKGAEVIRMMKRFLGPESFRRGMDLYFERHDGQAVTIEEFVKAMEDAGDIDLTQFRLWYSQAGTPIVKVVSEYNPKTKQYTLTLTQHCPDTPNQTNKKAMQMPIAISLMDSNGQLVNLSSSSAGQQNELMLNFNQAQQSFIFDNIPAHVIPLLLHDFSAPIKLVVDYTENELALIMSHATNSFCRWQACQDYFTLELNKLIQAYQTQQELKISQGFLEALRNNLLNPNLDKAFIAELLELPSIKQICSLNGKVDIDAIYHARKFIISSIADTLKTELLECYLANQKANDYQFEKSQVASRRLKNQCLSYLLGINDGQFQSFAVQQFTLSNNMTDELAAIRAIANSNLNQRDECLETFYQRWHQDALVLDKWFAVQALSDVDDVFEQVIKLSQHPDFTLSNPNRLRALIATFCIYNVYHFHHISGRGYRFLADNIIKLNGINPQIAARLMEPFTQCRKFDEKRQQLMIEQLNRIAQQESLSDDVYEIVNKCLNQ